MAEGADSFTEKSSFVLYDSLINTKGFDLYISKVRKKKVF